jgi:M3 family oligoendopeptidase
MAEVSERVRWRNGGGWTRLLAQAPGGEPIEWRISVADIERDGPFSDYAGYDRTIVAEDRGFTLEFADGERVDVAPMTPFSFAGERGVFCRLHGSPASAFNVMTLRCAFAHEVRAENGEIEVSLVDVLADGPPMRHDFSGFDDWERARREFATWEALVKLRFAQNVDDERAALASQTLARLQPIALQRDAAMKRRLLEPRERALLEPRIGAHAFSRWEQDVLHADRALEPLFVRESALYDEYTRLTTAATYDFQGQRHTAASLGALTRSAGRDVRREATHLIWRSIEQRSPDVDRIFEQMIACRTQMARYLGYASYTGFAYRRLGRTDYSRADVAILRDAIREHITPICAAIVERQKRDLRIDDVMPWDEPVFHAGEPVRPRDDATLLKTLAGVLHEAHSQLGGFADMLVRQNAVDGEPRPGKRSGAFCSFFPSLGMAHIFANFTGTSRDVMSLVHESGHAFQDYSARLQPVLEYVIPPAETGEVFSLGLEFLLWPWYDRFFGEQAPRYRAEHVRTMVLMLPYIAAIDHFQELVYDRPDAQAQDRYAMWLHVHERYLSHRNFGDIAHLARGGAWQHQHHVFGFPFYYVDYALALFAAFDLWRQAERDRQRSINRYVMMAAEGGRLPFRQLLKAYGIGDPLQPATVAAIAQCLAERGFEW